MKTKFFASIILVIVLSFSSNIKAAAHGHRCWHRTCAPVVRVCPPPVVYERPYITYPHDRHYHPTPYCSRPVVFKRECRTMPWYYVNDHCEHHSCNEYCNHHPVHYEHADRGCEHRDCYRR